MKTVTIDIDKVKAAAATSPKVKKALQVLCPEAFERARVRVKTHKDAQRAYDVYKDALRGVVCADIFPRLLIAPRNYGNLAGQGFYLDGDYDWAIEVDDDGESVLTARCKEGR